MANPYTPFNDDVKEDVIATIQYIADIKAKMADLKKEIDDAEAWLKDTLGLDTQTPGTSHYGEKDGISVTFEVSPTYKVDENAIQELVEQNQVSVETVERLVSWSPKLIAKEWKTTDEETQRVLASAITTTYGKPTMKIEIKEK